MTLVRQLLLLFVIFVPVINVSTCPADATSELSFNLEFSDGFPNFDSSTASFQSTNALGASGLNLALDLQTAPTALGSTAAATGSAFITNHRMGLGFVVDSNGADESTSSLNFTWRTEDSWTLNPRDANSVLPNLALSGNFTAQVSVSYSGQAFADPSEFIGSPSTFEVFTGVGLETITMDNDIPLAGGTSSINQDFGVLWSNASEQSGSFSLEWRASMFLGDGHTDLSFIGTDSFTLNSITFSDGSTPEDHGFDIVFESGRLSPNISSVPEPTSVFILLCASLVIGYKRQRVN